VGRLDQTTEPPIRVPPQDLHAEQATLGSVLLEPEAAARVLALLGDADFYREAHRTIYRSMQAVARRREPVDLITVSAELRGEGVLDDVGGVAYLTALIGEVPTTAHVVQYARIVLDKSRLRRAVALGMQTAEAAYEQPEDVQAFLTELESRTFSLANEVPGAGAPAAIADTLGGEESEVVAFAEDELREDVRPKWGFPSVDSNTGGIRIPSLNVLMAFTGFGKSTLCAGIVYPWALVNQQPTAWFTTGEETRAETLLRLVQIHTCLDLSPYGIRRGVADYGEEFKERLLTAHYEVAGLAKLHIQPRRIGFEEFEAQTRQLVRQHGVRLVVLDYLERLDARNPWDRGSKPERMERLSDECHRLMSDLRIALVVVSQATEDSSGETRTRYTARLENDAHVVLRIDAPSKGTQEDRRASGERVLIERKVRRGKSGGRTPIRWQGGRFVEVDPNPGPEPRRDNRDGLNG
jgi:replicative DNA helicase